ncbi:NAD dependent epimerase/dehydratase family protein-like protein [Patellaria atrata CBS 101060]|uniref:NAD dependent epimerase/dehydratase family protein-like protein n=1 Tax=Patellaria atrata CBS 101060 TaxID=1346257 RepID=A0A9P4VN93_9PEZI|nr:NAD dependent epimerase/dehydratase family protein-like protein [Patellaria atrata CBS 101060]
MTSAVVVGSTGLVGSHILSTLLSHTSITAVSAYSRRPLDPSSSKLQPLTSTDPTTWPSLFPRSPQPHLFLSALGTTRTAAGSLENQRKTDLELNLALARAAKDAGVSTYVLVSTGLANSGAMNGYFSMKGELEDRVKELGFEYTVILRPGLLMGRRETGRWAELPFQWLAGAMGCVYGGLRDFWAVEARVVGRAAVVAGLECVAGKRERGVWVVDHAEILRLGRTE